MRILLVEDDRSMAEAVTQGLTEAGYAVDVIAIHNTGPGIAPEHLPYLFERFYRKESSKNNL